MNPPDISVVILNYKGGRWFPRCLESLRAQTIFNRVEVIIADNNSGDGSDRLAQELIRDWPNARFVQNGDNFGYCEGNNRGARDARGRYLLFLNNDTHMAPDCLELLLEAMDAQQAGAGSPQILNYSDGDIQGYGRSGFDLFGYYTSAQEGVNGTEVLDPAPRELFVAPGCAYMIRTELFRRIGEFDRKLFMYVDETDLSWRVWIAGERVIPVPQAKLYHWGGGSTAGGEGVGGIRASEMSLFYSNRNSLLVLCKSAEHLLWFLVFSRLLLLGVEGLVVLLLTRRWGAVQHCYLRAVAGCWRLRDHIVRERRHIAAFRRRGDFWMILTFLRGVPGRVRELCRHGLPKVSVRGG